MPITQFEGKALVFNNGVVDVQQDGVSVVDENKIAHITPGEMAIDELTIIKNADNELEVPFDNDTIYRDENSGFIKAKGGASEGFVEEKVHTAISATEQLRQDTNSEFAAVRSEMSDLDFVSEGRLQEAISEIDISDAKIILCTKVGDDDASPVGSFTLNQDSSKTITIPIPQGGGLSEGRVNEMIDIKINDLDFASEGDIAQAISELDIPHYSAGENITISSEGVISATGGGSGGLDSEGVRSLIKNDFGLEKPVSRHYVARITTYENDILWDPSWAERPASGAIDLTDIVDSIEVNGSIAYKKGDLEQLTANWKDTGSTNSCCYEIGVMVENVGYLKISLNFSFDASDPSTAELFIDFSTWIEPSPFYGAAINISKPGKLDLQYYDHDTNWARPVLENHNTSNITFEDAAATYTVYHNWNSMKFSLDSSRPVLNRIFYGSAYDTNSNDKQYILSSIWNLFSNGSNMVPTITGAMIFPIYLGWADNQNRYHCEPAIISSTFINTNSRTVVLTAAFTSSFYVEGTLNRTEDVSADTYDFTVTTWPTIQ